MGWFMSTLEGIKEATGHDPIECPRGWGQVSFVGSLWFIPPMIGIERKCPIGGVSECGECKYASNPDAVRLAEQLVELERLREDGALSPAEYETRRRAVVFLHSDMRGHGQLITAWILGPLGTLLSVAGVVLALSVHSGFWGMAGGGLVLVALAVSFGVLSRTAWPPSAESANA